MSRIPSPHRFQQPELLSETPHALVYRVWDAHRQEMVALKVLAEGVPPELRVRFQREARWQMNHASRFTLPVFAIGTTGADWIAMEYCPGGTLHDALAEEGPLDPVAACAAILQVLGSLSFAHAQSVIHRDIKPSNLLISHGGVLRLADFGIAMFGDLSRRTESEARLGTRGFSSPEQRQDPRAVTPQSDLYSVAATLFCMLTCRNSADLFLCTQSHPRFHEIPTSLLRIIVKGTRVDPAARHASATAMAEDVLEAVAELDPTAVDALLLTWEDHHEPIPDAPAPEASAPRSMWSAFPDPVRQVVEVFRGVSSPFRDGLG